MKGFGRGSKQLGVPTANFPQEVVNQLPEELKTGIYYGWAQVDSSPVFKMVLSVGWNPFYKNTHKSMETHILHTFENDFYGSELKIIMVGYIRPEKDFTSLDELIETIKEDIRTADNVLESNASLKLYKDDPFFLEEESLNR